MTARRTLALAVVLVALLAGMSEAGFSQFLINVQGPSPNLTVTTGTAGSTPTPVVNSNSRLRYRRWLTASKITVTTSCPGQSFNLTVVAVNPTIGVPAPPVSLTHGMAAQDFITGIPAGVLNQADATLQYTGSATFQQGNSIDFGNDVHVVTYTIVAQ